MIWNEEDTRTNYPYGLFATPMQAVVRIHSIRLKPVEPRTIARSEGKAKRFVDLRGQV